MDLGNIGPPPAAFRVKAGTVKVIELSVLNDDENGPLNLSGVQAIVFEIAQLAGEGPVPPHRTKSLGDGLEIVGSPQNGVIRITLTSADTADLSGFVRHETEIIDASGNKSSVFFPQADGSPDGWYYGLFTVEPQYIVAAA